MALLGATSCYTENLQIDKGCYNILETTTEWTTWEAYLPMGEKVTLSAVNGSEDETSDLTLIIETGVTDGLDDPDCDEEGVCSWTLSLQADGLCTDQGFAAEFDARKRALGGIVTLKFPSDGAKPYRKVILTISDDSPFAVSELELRIDEDAGTGINTQPDSPQDD